MSASGDIADRFVAAITGLSLAGAPGVRKRKRVALLDGDPAALILVAVADAGPAEPLGDFGDGLTFLTPFKVGVVALARNSGKAGENATIRGWVEAITAAFRLPTSIAGVNDIKPGGGSVFDATGVNRQALDWAEQTFDVEVIA